MNILDHQCWNVPGCILVLLRCSQCAGVRVSLCGRAILDVCRGYLFERIARKLSGPQTNIPSKRLGIFV